MQQSGQRGHWGGTAALWGGITGLFVALVLMGARLLGGGSGARAVLTNAQVEPVWPRVLLALAAAIAVFLAGFFVTRATRAVEAGIVAGLIAGAITGLAVLVLVLGRTATVGRAQAARSAPRLVRGIVGTGVARGVLDLFVILLVATGIGALGGLIGRVRSQPAGGSPYNVLPTYPPYPPYSPAPGQAWPPASSFSTPEDADTVVGTSPAPPPTSDEGEAAP